MTYLKRFFALFLAVVLVFGLAPFPLVTTNSYADEGTSSDTGSSDSQTAEAGKYRITVTPQSNNNAYDYSSLCFVIKDVSGNEIYTSVPLDLMGGSTSTDDDDSSAGTTDAKWSPKSVDVTLDTAPSTIEFSVSYMPTFYHDSDWTPSYEPITGVITFQRSCKDVMVMGTLKNNPPGVETEIPFCLCTIEPYGDSGASGPLYYVDASNRSQQKAESEYENFYGNLDIGETGERWYAVRESIDQQALVVTGDVNLVLCDSATLTASEGITIAKDSSLTIYCQSGHTGTLIATGTRIIGSSFEIAPVEIQGEGSAAIGGYGSVTINGGNIEATGGAGAAGIGSDENTTFGSITINGGTVTATGGSGGAGIGAGYCGNCGNITINGGTLDVIGGGSAAGIGTGSMNVKKSDSTTTCGTITINGGTVTTEGSSYGAGIGAGYGGDIPNITITGGTIKATVCKAKEGYLSGGAAIGGGDFTGEKNKGTITIGNDNNNPIKIAAIATGQGAGIGGGTGGDGETNGGASSGPIIISGANTVILAVSVYGAGIGSGGSNIGINSASGVKDQQVTINGGQIYAMSSLGGAGIGGGNKCSGGKITINGGVVSAFGGAHYASTEDYLGETYAVVSSREIMDTLGYYEELLNDMVAEMVIGWFFNENLCGAGIGGGAGGSTGTIAINGGTVEAQCGNKLDRAIGAGLDGSNGTSGISIYDKAKVTYGYLVTKSEEDSSIITTQSEGESTEKTSVTISGVVRASDGEAKKVNAANTNGYALIQEDKKDEGSGTVAIDGWIYGDDANKPVPMSNTNGTNNVTYLYKATDASEDAWSSDVPKNAGNYTVKAIFPETDTYAECFATADFEISQRAATLTTNDATKSYGQSDPAFTATADGLVSGDTLNYTISRESGEDAGTYAINATPGENPNYNVTVNNTGKLTINKAPGTGKVTLDDWTYGDAANTPVVTSETNGTDNVTYLYKATNASDDAWSSTLPTEVGTYVVKATFPETTNYEECTATAEFSIEAAPTTANNSGKDSNGNTAKTGDEAPLVPLTVTASLAAALAAGAAVVRRRSNEE